MTSEKMKRRQADPLATKRLTEVTTLTGHKNHPIRQAKEQVAQAMREAHDYAESRVSCSGHRHIGERANDPEQHEWNDRVTDALARLGLEYRCAP